MSTRIPVPPPPKKRRNDDFKEEDTQATAQRPKALEVLPPSNNWWERAVDQFNGNEGAGYAISFVLHIILLAMLSIPILHSLETDDGFTTLMENSANEEQVILDAPLDTLIAMPEEKSSQDQVQQALLDPILNSDYNFLPQPKLDNQTTVESDGDGTGSGGEAGGGRVAEPENAIKAGSFSVWPWPILAGKVNGQIRHGDPGGFPKVRQDYSIVIRVKTPKTKKFVRLSDFEGTVIGTDGYRQIIPDDAYYFRANGELVKARPTHRLPVIDGTAEILIRVPGASFAEVKDTIKVHSRIIDEEQEIALIFQARE